MKGMQKKYGIERVSDAGIREATIIGQEQWMGCFKILPILIQTLLVGAYHMSPLNLVVFII